MFNLVAATENEMCWRGHPDRYIRHYRKKNGGIQKCCLLCYVGYRNGTVRRMRSYRLRPPGLNGMSVIDASIETGVSERSIYRWKHGGPANEKNAVKFARALGVKFEELWNSSLK